MVRPLPAVGRLAAAFGVATAIVLVLQGTASAHAFLVNSTPRAGERLEAAPPSLELRFTEPVVGGSVQVEVRTAAGRRIDLGAPRILDGGLRLEAFVPPLQRGVYVVSWEARSAVDGHLEVGEFAFAVGVRGPLPSVARAGGGVDVPLAAASLPALAGLLLGAGGLVSERWIWSPVAGGHGVALPRLPVGWLLGIALAGTLVQILLVIGGGSEGIEMLASPAALLAVGQAVAVAYALWMLVLPRLRPWALVPLGLSIVAAAARSHAASGAAWWAFSANVIHLGAVALWIGALAHLSLVAWRMRGGGHRTAVVEGARRYAAMALALVALVLLSGTLVAFPRFSRPAELVSTTYGRILLIKLALVAATLALALAARRRALGAAPPSVGLLRRLLGPEAGVLLAVIATATVLASTAPPPPSVGAGTLLGPPPLEGPVLRLAGLAGSPLAVHLAATAGGLRIQVIEPSREPAAGAGVEVAGRTPDGTEVGISPRPCGPGCFTSRFGWGRGRTKLVVTVESDEWGEGALRLSVPWPPRPERPGLVDRIVEAMRAQPRVAMVERVYSGPGASAENTAELSGAEFVGQELYAAGGATDVRPMPSPPRLGRLTLYLPGSSIWYLLEFGPDHRLRRETIVSPGHQIERSFSYPRGPG